MLEVLLQLGATEGGTDIFDAYANLIINADETVNGMLQLQNEGAVKDPHTRQEFFRALISQANKLLKDTHRRLRQTGPSVSFEGANVTVTENNPRDICALAAQKLFNENERLRHMRYFVTSLPREEVAELDLYRFAHTRVEGPVPVGELMKKPIGQHIRQIVAKQFKDDEADFASFLKHPGAEMCYAYCENELLGFFGMTKMEDGTLYLDWYSTNPNAVVPGMAEAILVSAIRNLELCHTGITPWPRRRLPPARPSSNG